MAVYFVYRSHYDNLGCFHVKRFDADSVLAWFRSIWEGVPDVQPGNLAYVHAKRLVGRAVYSFGSLFRCIHEQGWPPPKSMKELVARLEEALYVNELKSGTHHVQVLTDDDELESAIYIFDDHYAAKHPDRAAFLMREDWRLPDGMVTGPYTRRKVRNEFPGTVAGEGRTFCVHFAAYDSVGLSDLEPRRGLDAIEGVRVPDLARLFFALSARADEYDLYSEVLSGLHPAVSAARGQEKFLLKAVAANPNESACWAAYSDWCEENGKKTLLERVLKRYDAQSGSIRKTRDTKKDRVLVQSHVAQASKHVARWGSTDLFHHLIFFDDLWANAHPHLAASILRVAGRWDPL